MTITTQLIQSVLLAVLVTGLLQAVSLTGLPRPAGTRAMRP